MKRNKMSENKKNTNRRYPWSKIPRGGKLIVESKSPKVIKSAINSAYYYGERHDKIFTVRREEREENDDTIYVVNIYRVE